MSGCQGRTTRRIPCEHDEHAAHAHCLFFKDHIFESWVGSVTSSDGGRTFGAEPSLVLPATWHVARMTHNLAIAREDDGRYLIAGGQFKRKGAARCGQHVGHNVPCYGRLPGYNGVWMAHGDTWRFVRGDARRVEELAAELADGDTDELALAGAIVCLTNCVCN